MSPSYAAIAVPLPNQPGPAPRSAGPIERPSRRPDDRFLDRELSWLEFNARVLELAADPGRPLLERVKFCAIFASNLDEFFMVRVAALARRAEKDDVSARETLARIRRRVLELEAGREALWALEIEPALADEGIVVAAIEDLDDDELAELQQHCGAALYPLLTPWSLGEGRPFPHVEACSPNLAVRTCDPVTGETRLSFVSIPRGVPRFTSIGSRGLIVPIEQAVFLILPRLFPQVHVLEHAFFRVTRDAEFEIAHDTEDILEAVSVGLRRRRLGAGVRLEIASPVSTTLFDSLAAGLAVDEDRVYMTRGLPALADLDELVALDRPDLKHHAWRSRAPARLANCTHPGDMFDEIRRGDILVHHPYDSFAESFERFVSGGAEDPALAAMKTTVYRTSDESPLVPALVEVAKAGRQAVCVVELKARFDEQRNIEWSRALESAGVRVAYGFCDLKVHAKTTLIVRQEGRAVRRYVHVGTGNYHASTARSYEDFGLFTADEEIAEDISDLFNLLTGFGRPERFRKILVAPFNLRERLVDEIRAVTRSARAGERARIRLKTNALTDEAIVDELYAASQAGARVDIVARSICSLRPGVPGLSENVHVRSVLGRFLEHSRVFLFEAGERSSAFIGSADLMPRNLDHRIEVAVPVDDERARAELQKVFEVLLRDDGAWVLGPDGAWTRERQPTGRSKLRSHEVLMRRTKRRTRDGSHPRPHVGWSIRGADRFRGRSPQRSGL